MKKWTNILIGKKRYIDSWYNNFPDLRNIVDNEISIDNSISDYSLFFRKINVDKSVFIIIDNGISSELINFLNEHFECKSIKSFILDGLCSGILSPSKLRIDASTACQLQCTDCYMRLKNSGCVGTGFLTFNNFKKIVDENPCIKEIELSNSGEIFLNPDLVKIIKYAFEKNIRLTAINGVNFNTVSDEQLDALVKYSFGVIGISLDGATQETYERYRRRGNYEKVILNIKKLIETKKKYNSSFPKIVWQFILMEHNEHEVTLVRREAAKLGIPVWYKLNWNDNYQPTNRELLQSVTGLQYLTRAEHLIKTSKTYLGATVCKQMFLSPQINWDGRLLGCCELFEEDYNENVFEIGLKEALKSPLFVQSKEYLLGKISENTYIGPCSRCIKHKKMHDVKEQIMPMEDFE